MSYGTPNYWMQQLSLAEQWKNRYAKVDAWKRAHKYYNQDLVESLSPNFNLLYMLVSSLIPSTVFQTPHAINTPRRPEYQTWARFFDSVDNWLLQETQIRQILRDAIVQAFLTNIAPIQLGYDFPSEAQEVQDRLAEMEFPRVRHTLDYTRKYNQPFFELIPAEDILFAPGSRNIFNMPWFAKYFRMPVRTVKELPHVRRNSVKPTEIASEKRSDPASKYDDYLVEDAGFVSFYEVHEQDKGTWFWIDTNGNYLIPPTEDATQFDGLPLEVLSLNMGTQNIWGCPTAAYIETQYLEGNQCRAVGMAQRNFATVKAFVDSSVIAEKEVERFAKGTLPIIPIDTLKLGEKRLSDAVVLVQPHVQLEYMEYQKNLLNDAQLLAGMGPNQFGAYARGRHTKFEAQVVDEVNRARSGIFRQELAELIGRHLNRINALVAKHWKANIVRKVIGVDGALWWVTSNGSEFHDIASQLVSTINVESLAPTSRDRRRVEMVEVLGVLSKFKEMQPHILPIVMQFLSSFEWSSLQGTLPQANNNPMPMNQFATQQAQLMNSPGTLQSLQSNLTGAQPALLGALPQGTPNDAA